MTAKIEERSRNQVGEAEGTECWAPRSQYFLLHVLGSCRRGLSRGMTYVICKLTGVLTDGCQMGGRLGVCVKKVKRLRRTNGSYKIIIGM